MTSGDFSVISCPVYEPIFRMYFKDIIGQEEIKERLRQSAHTGVVPHAQLFTEQGGAGAFPLALAYARYLNCIRIRSKDPERHCIVFIYLRGYRLRTSPDGLLGSPRHG